MLMRGRRDHVVLLDYPLPSMNERAGWMHAVEEVAAGRLIGLDCPRCRKPTMDAEWLPFGPLNRPIVPQRGGEYRLLCSNCGAENYILSKVGPDP
jgi:hypothetical protein